MQIKIRLHRMCGLIFNPQCLLPYYRLWLKQPWNRNVQAFFLAWKRSTCLFSCLTHYQSTHFRLFQIERLCRWQFKILRKWQNVIHTSRKHCGKRRNCSSRAISPFPSVFKRLVSQWHQKVSLCGNGLRFQDPEEGCWKYCGKSRSDDNQHRLHSQ